jgi:hypothetical protein
MGITGLEPDDENAINTEHLSKDNSMAVASAVALKAIPSEMLEFLKFTKFKDLFQI